MMLSRPADGTRWISRATWSLLILAAFGLLVSSVSRAATLAFNHDESLSFAIFTSNPWWRHTANDHLLNTMLMHWCSVLLGNSELSLRFPNLLAHALYLLCTLALLRRVRGPALQLAGFGLLNLNLFVAEYFFVARGYGLALALELLGLYLFVRAYQERDRRGLGRDPYLCVAVGSLAVLANFAFLNYHVPLLLACTWLLLTDGSLRRVRRDRVPAVRRLLVVSGLFLAAVLWRLIRLQRHGELYLGGHDGLLADTVASLVRCSLRRPPWRHRSRFEPSPAWSSRCPSFCWCSDSAGSPAQPRTLSPACWR